MTNWKDRKGQVWRIEEMPFKKALATFNSIKSKSKRLARQVDPANVRGYREYMPVNLESNTKYQALRRRVAQGYALGQLGKRRKVLLGPGAHQRIQYKPVDNTDSDVT